MGTVPIEHVLIHIRDTLATDGRVGELGLDVACEGQVVVVRGAVSATARQEAVAGLVREVLEQYGSGLDVRDETEVPAAEAPDREPEEL